MAHALATGPIGHVGPAPAAGPSAMFTARQAVILSIPGADPKLIEAATRSAEIAFQDGQHQRALFLQATAASSISKRIAAGQGRVPLPFMSPLVEPSASSAMKGFAKGLDASLGRLETMPVHTQVSGIDEPLSKAVSLNYCAHAPCWFFPLSHLSSHIPRSCIASGSFPHPPLLKISTFAWPTVKTGRLTLTDLWRMSPWRYVQLRSAFGLTWLTSTGNTSLANRSSARARS